MSSSKRLACAAGSLLAAATLALGAASVHAAEDLSALQVAPLRGQSADQSRRDRYECHNWAVEQTGTAPLAAPVAHEAEKDANHAKNAERAQRAIAGAGLGAAVGGMIRGIQGKDPGIGMLAGAAVGAGIGAGSTKNGGHRNTEEAQGPSDYLRALTACLEGRGYTVALPGGDSSASSPRSPATPSAGATPGGNVAASAVAAVAY
jgi:hypothetical protein